LALESGHKVIGAREETGHLSLLWTVAIGYSQIDGIKYKEVNMNTRVLVTYASKYGATTEIAEKIGQVLRGAGLTVDVLPTDRIDGISIYSAVVLGSAVYAGQWREEAITFLKAYEYTLADMPVWFFSSGPTGEGDPVELMKGWQFPKAQQLIANHIKPRDTVLFHGFLNMNELNFAEKILIKGLGAAVGDFRDWDSITAWANGIAEVLKKEDEHPQQTS
jgi:menaquinone-dependent protoporphyrinogen oxidase